MWVCACWKKGNSSEIHEDTPVLELAGQGSEEAKSHEVELQRRSHVGESSD